MTVFETDDSKGIVRDDIPNMHELSYSESSSNKSNIEISASEIGNLVTKSNQSAESCLFVSRIGKQNQNSFRSSLHLLDSFAERVIGPTSLMETVSCPCCNQKLDDLAKTVNEPSTHPRDYRRRNSLLCDSDDSQDEEEDDVDDLPGILAEGVSYGLKRIVAAGWVHKKGTGKDWLGSVAWKPRWCQLTLARVDGYDYDVPLLLIYWYPISSFPSTVLVLESSVVLAVDLENKDQWNSFRFEIRHVSSQENGEKFTMRTFSAPKAARDAWVYAISQTLLLYEKQKAKSKKLNDVACQKKLAANLLVQPVCNSLIAEVSATDCTTAEGEALPRCSPTHGASPRRIHAPPLSPRSRLSNRYSVPSDTQDFLVLSNLSVAD